MDFDPRKALFDINKGHLYDLINKAVKGELSKSEQMELGKTFIEHEGMTERLINEAVSTSTTVYEVMEDDLKWAHMYIDMKELWEEFSQCKRDWQEDEEIEDE